MRKAMEFIFFLTFAVCATGWFGVVPLAHAQSRQALQTRAAAPVGARAIGRLPASQQLTLAISLPLRNQEQLNVLLQQLEDPASPNYHQYLTSAQFTEQFGPTVEQYQQVISFAQSHGFTVTHASPSRRLLNVTGPVAAIEQTFQVVMQVYQHPTENRTYFAPNVDPTIEPGLPILGVSGLTTFTLPHPMLKHASPKGPQSYQTGSGSGGQFLGSDFRAAYYGGSMTGSGQALALSELGQWNLADVQAYFTSVSQPLNVPIVLELLGGTSGACPGACDDGEEANDVIQIISMAPGASVLIVYEDTSNNADVDIFDAFATDNISKQMSWSFGIGAGNAAADEEDFQQFHAQGQNFFVASGDEGANLGDGGWPGFSQNVTDVGGTDLTTASAGGAWASETGWVGSGTGWCDSSNSVTPCYQSPYDAIPSWQVPSIITAAGGSTSYRNLPDVSADANTDSFWCAAGTCQGGLGGTSLAAPRWAGFVALANEYAATQGDTIGFLNPLVWTIGQSSDYDTAFHDITSGSNPSGSTVTHGFTGSFTAMTGFDMVTGWGTPNGQGMIDALAPASTTNAYFTLAASPSSLSLTPGGAPGMATISLNSANGFSGSVTLSANVLGAPAGVTASFNPTSISGSQTSTLTVSTTSATPAGTLMLAVTGTGTGGIGTQPAFVTLALPDFSLSVTPSTAYTNQPSTIYLNQGSTSTAAVTVNSQNSFAGTVNLSASSLPTGVTGSFSPISTASTSTLTLKATSTAATVGGDYLTVSGTSGNIAPLNAPYTILSVSAATGTGGSGIPVSLSSAYNLPAIYSDGITFGTGLDGEGSAYSANLLTPNRILNGVQFNFGAANTANCGANGLGGCVNDAVSTAGQTITLPANQQSAYTALQLLATAFDGPILSQKITVTYTDGTTSAFTQNFSDWCSCSPSTPGPGQQPGETFAVVMPYRDIATGGEDNTPFNLYAYTFVLNSAKTVQSFTLPAKPSSGGVAVFAATLTTQSLGTQVSLASEYNTAGIYNNGITFPATGGMDGGGNSCGLSNGCADGYSAEQLNLTSTTSPALVSNGLLFNLGPVNTADCTSACFLDMININPGANVTLPSSQQQAYTTLTLLGTGVQGSHTGTVTVTYTSGTPSVFQQTFSDWCNYQNATGNESIAVGGMSRINSDGTLNTVAVCNLYSYTYTLDPSRIVQSISMANSDSTNFSLVLALTLSGNTSTVAPSYSLSAGAPTQGTISPGGSSQATITLASNSGYTGTVTLSCSIAPVVTPAPTCSFGGTSPVTVTSSGGSATLTFTSVGPSGKLARTPGTFYALWLPIPGLALIGAGLGSRGPRRRRLLSLLLLWMVLAGLIIIPACGGSSSSGGGGGGGGNSGTPAGTYTITVTGTDANGATQSNTAPTVQVTVN
ncbi:MAG TPA: S53 family peptidase [Terriglobales bacterium]|nr:S53 family peptidase [Terriglobales bacterium]